MIVIFHIDDYRVVYYTIIMAVYFTDIIYRHMQGVSKCKCHFENLTD